MTRENSVPQGNWGRWGSEDERGTVNLLTPEVVRASTEMVRTGRVYSLARPLQSKNVPVVPNRFAPQHLMTVDGGDYAAGFTRKSNHQSADDVIMLPTHGTTHIDALAHLWYDHLMFNGHSGNLVRSTHGAMKCGIDKVGPIVGRGVMLDIAAYKGVDVLESSYSITATDLEGAARAQGVEIRQRDILLVRTGWYKTFEQKGIDVFFKTEPGIGMDAVDLIVDKNIVAVGSDNYAVEVVPAEDGTLGIPVHCRLIRDYGVYIMELFDLDALARDRVFEFLFVAAPLNITGGVGSPLTPVAIA